MPSSTPKGQRTDVSLTDQSLVHLSAQTSILIQETSHGRKITLNSGEILADVRHDETRPFEVLVDNLVIRDIGTRFDVATHDGTTDVAVVTGQVRIYERQADGQLIDPIAGMPPYKRRTPVLLKEGDMARLKELNGKVMTTLTSHTSSVSKHGASSSDDRVDCSRCRLDELVKEVNRYHRDQIVIDDSRIGRIYVGVIMNSNHIEVLSYLLKGMLSVDVVKIGPKDAGGALTYHLRWPSDPSRGRKLTDELSRYECWDRAEEPQDLGCDPWTD